MTEVLIDKKDYDKEHRKGSIDVNVSMISTNWRILYLRHFFGSPSKYQRIILNKEE